MKAFTILFAALVLIAGMSVAATAQRNGGGGGRNNGGINARQRNQEKRIRQGERDGSLTPKEAANLQKKEEKVRELEAKLRENGLTPKERQKLEKDLDKLNREIYKLEHNNKRRTT
jgi:TolA-binding protein